jgi:hypothetical protein
MTMTTDQARPVSVGDTLHVLAGGVLVFGNAWKRGDAFTLTPRMVESTLDINGDSWLDDLSEAGQLSRWGSVKFGLGPFPADLHPWIPGSRDEAEAMELARKAAWRLDDPRERAEALAELDRVFGHPETSTTISRTVPSGSTPPARQV